MSKNEKRKILVIEDEAHIAEGLKLNLNLQGYDVQLAKDGIVGLELWESWKPDLLVLDLMMPRLDGYGVLQKVREKDEMVPILILSAKDAVADKVKCLRGGVDDYLAKPFDLDEFLLRVERLLKRSSHQEQDRPKEATAEFYKFGNNTIEFSKLIATGLNGEVQLTHQEVKLLKLFIRNEGLPMTRQELLELAWGYSEGTSTRTVDNFIVRFRKYFEQNPKKPIHFKSLRSVGYVFNQKATED